MRGRSCRLAYPALADAVSQTQFVLKNVFRNLRRTILTAGSVTVSVFLLALLFASYRYISAPPASDRTHLILVVTARTSLINPMPVRYAAEISQLAGVAAAMPLWWFDGRYGNDENIVPALACDAQQLFAFTTDWKLPGDERRAFEREKDALIAGRKTAEKYGWKIGDHIHLKSPNYLSVPVELVLRGVYTSTGDDSMLAMHWSYLNEALGRPNVTGEIWVLPRSAQDVPDVMQAIDAHFHNSAVETRTQTLKQFELDFLGWLGNVKQILLIVFAAVVFAVLLVVANTMAMSIRERTAEIAILRALGFRTRRVVILLTAESASISVAGAVVGCMGASAVASMLVNYRIGGAMPADIRVDWQTVVVTLLVAVGISLASTMIPALNASRASIANMLRRSD